MKLVLACILKWLFIQIKCFEIYTSSWIVIARIWNNHLFNLKAPKYMQMLQWNEVIAQVLKQFCLIWVLQTCASFWKQQYDAFIYYEINPYSTSLHWCMWEKLKTYILICISRQISLPQFECFKILASKWLYASFKCFKTFQVSNEWKKHLYVLWDGSMSNLITLGCV